MDLVHFLFGSRSEKEEDNFRHYEASATDTLLPMGRSDGIQKDVAHYNYDNDDDDDEHSYDELIDEEEGVDDLGRPSAHTDPVYVKIDAESRAWIDYIVEVCHDRYSEPHAMVSLTYKSFSDEYPSLDTLNYDAIEYVRSKAEFNPKERKEGRFKCLFYSDLIKSIDLRQPSCFPVPGVNGIFLVNIQHDYVYGRAIECALLKSDAQLAFVAKSLFQHRRELSRPCERDHVINEKLCPSEWILYVDQTSEFYAFCCKQLKELNPLIDHAVTANYVNTEFLSFYLVLFLCGEYMEPMIDFSKEESHTIIELDEPSSSNATTIRSAYYNNINQWKKLPIWFLDVWYSSHSSHSDTQI